jgi:hypothetical protein
LSFQVASKLIDVVVVGCASGSESKWAAEKVPRSTGRRVWIAYILVIRATAIKHRDHRATSHDSPDYAMCLKAVLKAVLRGSPLLDDQVDQGSALLDPRGSDTKYQLF